MLDYLSPFKKSLDWDALLSLKREREAWWQRESAQKWKVDLDQNLCEQDYSVSFDHEAITIGERHQLTEKQRQHLEKAARQLIPWKKGPFQLFHLTIDAEWRSNLKWERLQEHLLPLEGKKVLDVGCNNGYFLFRMAAHSPALALGIDPVLPMQAQFDLIQTYARAPNTYFELFGVEHLPFFHELFDTIFHMGIIYHHRHPIQQLIDIREALKPGGQAILETIGIPGQDSIALFPPDRYARMGNVWFVPTLSCLINWAKKARFIQVEVIADTELTEREQRLTPWCPAPFQSLSDSLDPEDPSLTIEGHPAPRRFLLSVRKKGGQ